MTEPSVDLVPSVKRTLDAIIASEKMFSPPTISIAPGSQLGDGFASKTSAITITGSDKTINLFVKYLPEIPENPVTKFLNTAFWVELRFYETIFPAMLQFQQEKGISAEEMFDNVSKHYKLGIKYEGAPPIVLENLRSSGYTLRNFREPIDDDHITLALKTFAKYHAVSYAMKDQKPDLFKHFSTDIKDFYPEIFNTLGLADNIGGMVDGFVSTLDPVIDKKLLNECRNVREILIEHVSTINKQVDDYAVICQGDCWSNNMMFQYDEKTGLPINIKLVDWQIQRYNSPVLDVVYYFYTVATKDILTNFDKYIKLYYETLADYMRKLGSDSRKMYPRVIFLNHWKKFAKFGLTMAFGLFMIMHMKSDALPNMSDNQEGTMPTLVPSFERPNEYYAKIRLLVEHFVERDFL